MRAGRFDTDLLSPPKASVNSSKWAPLSFAQERLWFLDQLEPGSSLYNVSAGLQLVGDLDEDALRKALDTIVARHEVLRTTFESRDGVPVQVIHPPCPADWAKTDLSALAEGRRDAEARALVMQETRKPFDLSTDPMLRARLFRLAPDAHILLLVMHHIATDGWSTDLLLHEMSMLYNARVHGEEPAIPELTIQYADYAAWQRERLQGSLLERDLTYWRRQLEGVSRLGLPTDRTRGAEPEYRGDFVAANLPASVAERLKHLGHEENATLFMVLLAVLMVFLRRYSGQDDLCVGAPIAGRTRADQENLIGFFVNMLIIREDLSSGPGFRDVLRSVRSTCLEAYEHQDVPFERLVAELQPARLRNQTPFFQVTFSLQHGEPRRLEFSGLTCKRVSVSAETSKFDLSVFARETENGLALSMNYPAALFNRPTVQQMLQCFCQLCEVVADHPARPIDSISVAIDREAQARITALNETDRSYPRDSTLPKEFESQAARSPDAIAVAFGDRRMTYRELSRQSNQLAHYLQREGVLPESLVGVCMERSAEMIVSLLAILKAGGAYVPLDPEDSAGRLRQMIEESHPTLVLSHSGVSDRLPARSAPTLLLDEVQTSLAQEPISAPVRVGIAADELAYVMFTSGSTGRPKGVEVTHRGVLRLVKGVDYVHLEDCPRILQLASPAFDAATFEIWGALLNGGQCVLGPERIPSVSELGRLLREFRIDTLWLTATWFNVIVDEDPTVLSGVRELIVGGEPLSVPHVAKALQVLHGTSITNGYGPTEGTTFACCYRVPGDFDPRRSSIPIGRPISNTKVYILDSHAGPTPAGVPGELCIGGDGLARGYLRDPLLTAERFIPNPFADRPADRLYRTGDRVRLLPSGDIEYLGRLDRQLKIRGFRIEPGEIEHTLRQHPDVRDARVVLQKTQDGDSSLAAYVIPTRETLIAPDSLKAFAAGRLPEYMVPVFYVSLQEYPLTSSGKLDLRALPAPHSGAEAARPCPLPARSDVEKRMKEIWLQLLDCETLGIRDNFFDLGGHSLLAVRLIARVERVFGVPLPVSALFDYPTIEALGRAVDERSPRLSRSTVVRLQKGDGGRPFFCVPPAASSVNHFAPWVLALSSDIPFYAMHALGLEPGEVPQDRVEDLAARYIADMRAVQPVGPYSIGGRCFGSYVAYEMAVQLSKSGEEVALLALLDPTLPPGVRRDFRYYIKRAGYFSRRKELVRATLRWVRWTARQMKRVRVLVYLGTRHTRRIERTYRAHLRAQETYVPETYLGAVAFFATRAEYSPDDARPLWRDLARGDFDLHLIPGTHYTMSQVPHLQVFMRELEDAIREARRARAPARAEEQRP